TFFHEVGHIVLHGKKYISIENIEIEGENDLYEKQADKFASDIILSGQEEAEICKKKKLTLEDINHFAKKFGTHPASIIGRLQHKRLIPFGAGNVFFKPIDLCNS